MKSNISLDLTAINMDGQGSFSATYQAGSEQEVVDAITDFRNNCPFSKYDLEHYAEHEDGTDLNEEENGWLTKQGLSL